jgi:hypothetical protein
VVFNPQAASARRHPWGQQWTPFLEQLGGLNEVEAMVSGPGEHIESNERLKYDDFLAEQLDTVKDYGEALSKGNDLILKQLKKRRRNRNKVWKRYSSVGYVNNNVYARTMNWLLVP